MPLTSIFEVCEIKIKQPLVSKQTLDEFEAQLDVRRRKRNRRARDEKRREKMIKAEEDKRMGKFPDMKHRIESAFHFPQVGNLSNARSTESLVSVESNLSTSPNLGADSTDGGAFSFARMLKQGAAKPSTSATALTFPRSETFPSLSSATPKAAKKNEDSEPEPEDYVPPPPKANLGDALAHALSQATISGNTNGKSKTSNGKKKKMKGQKISLTGSSRPMMDF